MRIAVCGITPSSVHFRTYVDFLLTAGHDVTVLTNVHEMPGSSEKGSLRVVDFAERGNLIRFVPRGLRLIPRLVSIARALRRGEFDVLDIMQVTPDGVYAALMWEGPLVLDFWGSDIMRLEIRPWWVQRLMPRAIRRADEIHSVSEEMTGRLSSLGAESTRIETFQYGIDLNRFSFGSPPHRAGRIVHTRGVRPFYRSDIVIRALRHVLKERPEATIALTGAGDGLAELRELAGSLGVSDKVEFLGYVTEEQLAEQLRSAVLWVSIPPTDGTPLSLLEAMASGTLPVVSDLPTVRDWVGSGRGVLIDDVTPEGVARGLLDAFDLAERGDFAEPNRRLVEERGDRAVNLPRWEQMLERAAAAHQSRAKPLSAAL